jgi:acyl dehydratase
VPRVLYAEDLPVGRVFALGTWAVTIEDIKDFARAWDPLPFHLDDEAAAAGPFGGIIASGLHTQAILIRLGVESFTGQLAFIAARELRSMRMFKPVRPGETLTGTIEIEEQRLRDDGRAVIVYRSELADAKGEVVLRLVLDVLVNRQPAIP